MAKGEDRGYREQGIKDDVDYGTQFLNGRAAADGGEAPPAPPPAPPSAGDEPPGGRGVGTVLMVVLIVGALAAGVAGFLLFGGGGDDDSGDLVTAGDVEIDENGFPVRETTTTTEAPRATTTTTTTATTSTTLAPTTTASTAPPPTAPTTPPTPPPTQAPSCPGGSSQTTLSVRPSTTGNGQWLIDMSGTTSNGTTAPFDLTLVVTVQHEPAAGNTQTREVRTDQNGRSVPAGGSIDWTASVTVPSKTEPRVLGAGGAWRWSEPRYASCPTGTFG
jgi:hypothetical protein